MVFSDSNLDSLPSWEGKTAKRSGWESKDQAPVSELDPSFPTLLARGELSLPSREGRL
jgi:hypothetical protein